MDKIFLKFLLILSIFSNAFPAVSQLIKDPAALANIDKQLLIQKELAKARSNDLFGPFKTSLGTDEQLAMNFIYAYMPLSDLADYSQQFFLDNIRMSLKARDEMLWGKDIPEDIFLHFVLPLRVNNENLDSFRILMYDEIKSRINGMAMKDAVLELNHWCHEKVTYKASDERTSSPLSSMRYSFGRCGEESTFTVSALRTAGIPARQVYTPRWAHTDDNHAWVEAWVDGKWYFLGACEPSPELNMGWFAAPATRAMLMNTRAYGWYNGSEPRIENEARFSELNLIAIYASVKKIFVKIINQKSQPVENAKVEFQLYNYAEFYPLTKSYTGKDGLTSVITGYGDLLIWANKDLLFGSKKITIKNEDTVIIELKSDFRNGAAEEFDFVPPVEGDIVKVGEKGKIENDRRLLIEDSIRQEYMKSFKDSVWASDFAEKLRIDSDSTIMFIVKSFGNWPEIKAFLENTKPEWRSFALKLLSVMSVKDLRDTKASILDDHLRFAMPYYLQYKENEQIWEKYLLSGRIGSEMMVAWKEYLRTEFKFSNSNRVEIPGLIKKWIIKNIRIDAVANVHSRAPLTPVGVYKLKVADSKSRDIFFVAACRANGIASRLQPETLIPQVWVDRKWKDIFFDSNSLAAKPKAYLNLKNASQIDPKYFIHFTLALFENGVYRSLQFEEEKPLSHFKAPIEVPAGNYMLVTGNRLQDGSVLCKTVYFELKANETKEIQVNVREFQNQDELWGPINFNEFSVKKFDNEKTVRLSEIINNKPSLIIFIESDKEPTKHVMVDLQPIKAKLEKWGGAVVFVLQSNKTPKTFSTEMFPGLASQSSFVWDIESKFINKIEELKSMHLAESLPVIIYSDSKGNLSYFSKGYRIGVGDQLIKILK
jgi:hypothetical protein